MTVNEFEKQYSFFGTRIQVKSAFNGKTLCKHFNKKKHIEIGERTVVTIKPEIEVRDGTFAHAFIALEVSGDKEYREHLLKKQGENNNDKI